MPDIPLWLQAIFYALSGTGLGGYAVHRTLKRDRKVDNVDGATKSLIDALTEQLKEERKHSTALGKVIDQLSAERNDAVRTMGEMSGQMSAMTSEIGRLKDEIVKQERLNVNLSNSVTQLREEVLLMAKQLVKDQQ